MLCATLSDALAFPTSHNFQFPLTLSFPSHPNFVDFSSLRISMASFLQLPAAALIQVPASSDVAFLLASEFFSTSLILSLLLSLGFSFVLEPKIAWVSFSRHLDMHVDTRLDGGQSQRCIIDHVPEAKVLCSVLRTVSTCLLVPRSSGTLRSTSAQLRACTRMLRREAAAQLTFYTGRGGKVLQRGALNAPVPAYQDFVPLSLSLSPTAKCQHTKTNSNGNSRSWWGRVGIANNTSYR